jgi:hypothetical protein
MLIDLLRCVALHVLIFRFSFNRQGKLACKKMLFSVGNRSSWTCCVCFFRLALWDCSSPKRVSGECWRISMCCHFVLCSENSCVLYVEPWLTCQLFLWEWRSFTSIGLAKCMVLDQNHMIFSSEDMKFVSCQLCCPRTQCSWWHVGYLWCQYCLMDC